MTKLYKSIAYAYATSPAAERLGFRDTGCFYVQQRTMNEAGEWYTFDPVGVEGFLKATNADLIAFYKETAGEPCPMFLRHGNQDALNLLKAA